jgi:hypothetical protein
MHHQQQQQQQPQKSYLSTIQFLHGNNPNPTSGVIHSQDNPYLSSSHSFPFTSMSPAISLTVTPTSTPPPQSALKK